MSGRDLSRASRGNRMQHLLENEDEDEDEFWAQGGEVANFFADEAEDRSFDSDEGVEESGEESADSDIDDSEEVNDAEDEEKAAKADKEADKSNRKKRKSVYVDPAKLPQSKRKAATAAPKSDDESGSDTETKQGVEDAAAAAADGEAEATPKKRGRKPKQPIEPTDAASDGGASGGGTPVRPTLRKSTMQYSQMREAERAKETAEAEKRKRPKAPKIVRQYTQEELLEEAKITAIENKKSLAELIKFEEEMKKVPTTAPKIQGPMIRTLSRNGQKFITWTDDRTMPDFFYDDPEPYPGRMVCEVTGERAKYRDPKTGKAFASSSAFRALRERYDLNERKKMYGLDEESKARDALFRQQQQEAMDTSDTAPIAYTQAPLHAQYAQYLPVGSGVQSVPIGPNMVIPPMASHSAPHPYGVMLPTGTFQAAIAPHGVLPMSYAGPLDDAMAEDGARPKRKYNAITPQEGL